jgi:hypothetical protein
MKEVSMTMIFSIAPSRSFDLGAVIKSAYRFLDGSVSVLQESGCVYDSSRKQGAGRDEFGTSLGYEKPFSALFLIQLRPEGTGIFRVTPRDSTPTDFEAAKAAAVKLERAERGDIAARCQTVWEVVADVAPEFPSLHAPAPRALLSMCAVLAGAARGPMLLSDGTLLDAKSAWEQLRKPVETAA